MYNNYRTARAAVMATVKGGGGGERDGDRCGGDDDGCIMLTVYY